MSVTPVVPSADFTAPTVNGFKLAHRFSSDVAASMGSGFRRFKAARAIIHTGRDVVLDLRTPIKDQGSAGSCVANAGLACVEHGMSAPRPLSRRLAYWHCRRSHGEECRDEGTWPHVLVEVLRRLGCCTEERYPYSDDPEAIVERPTDFAEQGAYDNRILGGHALDGSGGLLEDIEASLRRDRPIFGGWDIRQSFADVEAGHVYQGTEGGALLGGHSMAIWGIRTRADGARELLLRNSWGTGFGEHGLVWVSAAFARAGSDLCVF